MELPFKKAIESSPHFKHVKRHWLTIAFIGGFVIDNLTLNRVDQLFDNLVLLFYVVLAALSMMALYAAIAGKVPERSIPYIRQYSPLLQQYAFGGLLSGMLIFYGRSGAWIESWPFLLVILAVIFGNELIHDRISRLLFNLSVYFIGLTAYAVLIIPVITGRMGPWIFIGSGLLAVFCMYWLVVALYKIIPNFIRLQLRTIIFTLGAIYVGFNFLYFTNIIPPIPLSLKDVGIYHSVIRFENGEYQLTYEEPGWWQFWKDSDTTFHPNGDPIFCFARVFAPTRLHTEIYHRWEYYDDVAGKWVDHGRLSYSISGGRNDGYRGYTQIANYQDGKWRCSVETARGQILGQETFVVDSTVAPAELVTVRE